MLSFLVFTDETKNISVGQKLFSVKLCANYLTLRFETEENIFNKKKKFVNILIKKDSWKQLKLQKMDR